MTPRTEPATRPSSAPVLVATLGIFVLTAMDGLLKKLAQTHAVADIALARYLVAGFACLPFALAARMRRPSWASVKAQALRGVAVLATSLLFITALKHLPLSEALTLTFLAPSLVALFGRVLLHEPVSRATGWSIAVSFLGVLAVAGKDIAQWRAPTEDLVGVAAALGAAVAYALSLVSLRSRAKADGFVETVLIQNVLLTLYLTPLAAASSGVPLVGLLPDWPLALGVGALGAAGHLLLGWAYRHAAAARIGAAEYTGLVWGVIIGVVWFGEWPGVNVLVGAALIVGGSSLLLVRR